VGISALAITPVAIDTVPNVRVKPKIGYKLDKASFSSTYFHVVFTLPDSSINVLAMQDPRLVYDLFEFGKL
jgi:hypothetical protein